MAKYVLEAVAWGLSNVAAMAAGGYIAYRFRDQIDALVAKAEAAVAYVYSVVKHTKKA